MEILAFGENRFRLLSLSAFAAIITACASASSIPSPPFADFEQTVVQLKVSADQALAIEQKIVYERYLDQLQATGIVEDLQLQGSERPSPFSMQLEGAILFKDIAEARSKLDDMNSLIVQYAGTLLVLTGSAEDSTTIDADAAAEELRTSATALATRLGKEGAIPDGYFFGFGVLAKNYAENKRQDALTELIRSSQPEIAAFAEAGQQICQISGLGIQAEYGSAFSRLTEGAAGMPESRREDLIQSILDLNDETLQQLEILRLIYEAYGALPAAHRSLEGGASGSASFIELLAYTESLKNRYDKFSEE